MRSYNSWISEWIQSWISDGWIDGWMDESIFLLIKWMNGSMDEIRGGDSIYSSLESVDR